MNRTMAVVGTPPWMKYVLYAAGAYNLAWGAFAILTPQTIFHWAGMEPPRYPELWQCIGMIVGVYGIGYGIAARDPVRHWPIVLVGLLGKLFGPVGFARALLTGSLPIAFGATIITNDLIWWYPFLAILWHAFRENTAPETTGEGLAVDAMHSLRGDNGQTLAELSETNPVLVTFVRHEGCVFHRQAVADLMRAGTELKSDGVRLALVHMGNARIPAACSVRREAPDVVRFEDPQCRLYREFGLERGSPWQLFGPAVWWPGLKALLKGHGLGVMTGDGCQLGGTFLIDHGKIVSGYACRNSADRPDYVSVARQSTSAPAQTSS